MTTHIAYEVRVRRNRDWRVEAIFDDESLAVAAARRLEQRGQALPVIVLQEKYDAARNHLKSRSIYHSGRSATADVEARGEGGEALIGVIGITIVVLVICCLIWTL